MELEAIIGLFLDNPDGNISVTPVSAGHINNTFLLEDKTTNQKYILQRINKEIFPKPENIAHNHLEVNRILSESGYKKQLLEPILTKQGNYLDEKENAWRLVKFIENSHTFMKVPDNQIAYRATQALSEFYSILNSAENADILDPLLGFIDFEKRINDYKKALANSSDDLKINAEKEISFINQHIDLPEQWVLLTKDKALPQRIIHADPKISNLLFSADNQVLAVIDLDTVMYGSLLYDFGDMIRSYTNMTDEDDGKTQNVFSAEIYSEVRRGFLSHLQNILTEQELDLIDYAAKVVIYIQAVRFLTDYLNGSVYYSVSYESHNLDRTKNQIQLLKGVMDFLD